MDGERQIIDNTSSVVSLLRLPTIKVPESCLSVAKERGSARDRAKVSDRQGGERNRETGRKRARNRARENGIQT